MQRYDATHERSDTGALVRYSDYEQLERVTEEMAKALDVIEAATNEDTRPYRGWMPIRALADKLGIYNEDFEDAARLIPVIAKAALASYAAWKGK